VPGVWLDRLIGAEGIELPRHFCRLLGLGSPKQAVAKIAALSITTNLNFAEWVQVFGGEKMTTALLDRITHHCDTLETGNVSYRFKHRKKIIENS
jgi:hypothetical protein